MMAEAGGQTLQINPEIYNATGNYYGICQWGRTYYPDVQGKDLDYQLQFLMDTIAEQFDYCGEIFGCTYDQFLELEDEQYAALIFAKVYERCDSASHYNRKVNATVALEYFTNLLNKE